MILSKEAKEYLVSNRDKFLNRTFLINTFVPKPDKKEPLIGIHDTFTIEQGDIENYSGSSQKTTVGRFIFNYIILVNPFNDLIPYINDLAKLGKIEKIIAEYMITGKVTVDQFNIFLNNAYFIGHFTELGVPTLSDKAFGPPPDLKKVKKALFEKHKGNLNDPKVIKEIEDVLFKMDKEYLKDDPCTIFFDGLGSKSYDIHRKKMYLTVGGIEAFETDNNSYVFMKNSLNEGWEKRDFKIISDEIRKASFSRGAETAKAGDQTKFILRIFNNVMIKEDDCGTTRGLSVTLNEKEIGSYVGRTVIVGGKQTTITFDNKNQFANKPIKIRSPMYCSAKQGLCYKCCGSIYEKLGVSAIGMEMINVSSTMMMIMMKNFHGTKVEFVDVNPLEYFA